MEGFTASSDCNALTGLGLAHASFTFYPRSQSVHMRDSNSTEQDNAQAEQRTSRLLQDLLETLPANEVSLDYLVQGLKQRSFGGLVILLAVIGLVPGISVFAGLALLLPGIQMLLGFRAPHLPRFLRQQTIEKKRLQAFGQKFIPWLQYVENHISPRWLPLTQSPMPHLMGALVILLGLVVMLPFPFTNILPVIALIMLSLGLLESDGLMVLAGFCCAVLAILIGIVVAKLAFGSLFLLV